MSIIELQPEEGYITLDRFADEFVVTHNDIIYTAADIVEHFRFTGNDKGELRKRTLPPIEKEVLFPSAKFAQGIHLQEEIAISMFSQGTMNVLQFSNLNRLKAAYESQESVALSLNGTYTPGRPIDVFIYDPEKISLFAKFMVKILNVRELDFKIDSSSVMANLSLFVRDFQDDAPRCDLIFEDTPMDITDVTNSVLNWPLLPLLIDIFTVVNLDEYVLKNKAIIQVLFFVILSATTEKVKIFNSRIPKLRTTKLFDFGFMLNRRVTRRFETITFDNTRYDYVSKLCLMILLRIESHGTLIPDV